MSVATVTEKTRASLPIRDYIVATVALIGVIVYMERRLAVSEEATRAVVSRVASLESDKKDTGSKINSLITSVNEIKIGVARVEERTRGRP